MKRDGKPLGPLNIEVREICLLYPIHTNEIPKECWEKARRGEYIKKEQSLSKIPYKP